MGDYIIGIMLGGILGSLATSIAMKSHQTAKESAQNKQRLQQYQDKKLWDDFFRKHSLYLDWDMNYDTAIYGSDELFNLRYGTNVIAKWYKDGKFDSCLDVNKNMNWQEYLDIIMFIKINAKTDNMFEEWKELGY